MEESESKEIITVEDKNKVIAPKRRLKLIERQFGRSIVLNKGDVDKAYLEVFHEKIPSGSKGFTISEKVARLMASDEFQEYIKNLSRGIPFEAIARFELLKGLQKMPEGKMSYKDKHSYVRTALEMDDGPLSKNKDIGGNTNNIAVVIRE